MAGETKAAKKKVNSRAKGRAFEQEIARQFRAWLGGDWKIARNQTDRQKGQVEGNVGEFKLDGPYPFPFAVECKAHESFEYDQLFRSPVVGPFPLFWKQAEAQAEIGRARPLLILKRNLGEVLAAMRHEDCTATIPPSVRYCRLQVRIEDRPVDIVPLRVLWSVNPGVLTDLLPMPPAKRR